MTAVILAGGRGTRLHPYTFTIPKPLLPLGDAPIIEVLFAQLREAGVDRIILTLGHMSHLFRAYFEDGSRIGVPIEYSIESEPLGTAAPLRQISLPDEDFLVLNGDILTDLDYRELVESHRKSGAWATIALSHREVFIDYGVIVTDEQNRLAEYIEKPRIPYDVSMGIYVLNKNALSLLPSTGKFDIPDLMSRIHQEGKGVNCFRFHGYWKDIGRVDDYEQASIDFRDRPERFIPQ